MEVVCTDSKSRGDVNLFQTCLSMLKHRGFPRIEPSHKSTTSDRKVRSK